MRVVAVCGSFDLTHAGHVDFLERARAAGGGPDALLCVAVRRDEQVLATEGLAPSYPAKERQFMLQNLRCVARVELCRGDEAGGVECGDNLDHWRPDIFVAQAEDASLRAACEARGVQFQVLDVVPDARTTEEVRDMLRRSARGETPPPRNASPSPPSPPQQETPRLAAPRPAGARPVVFVSGCYDLLHSGHVAFFNEASLLGDLYVSVGSDANIELLKKHSALFSEEERRRLVSSVRSVSEARVCRGSGMLDFEQDLDVIQPDIFFVNEDGHRESKEEACKKRGIRYIVGTRVPAEGLDARSSTALKASAPPPAMPGLSAEEMADLMAFPWRICLAGGWLDQPWVSEVVPGPVIVVNIEPHAMFKRRSGLATSTRQVGIRLWGTLRGGAPPEGESRLALAKMLFGAENPPGVKYVAGSQDALGLMLPGINRLDYDGSFWPREVVACDDVEAAARWLESVLWLVPLPSRADGYDPLLEKHLTEANVTLLARASAKAWDAIQTRDAALLGTALSETMAAWRAILPLTVPQPESDEWCAPYRATSHGCLFTGCGGGFLMVVSDQEVAGGFQVKVRTRS